jgi:hypothetical protein
MGDMQSAILTRLLQHGFNYYSMFIVDLLHEFKLGMWKAIFMHLLCMLYTEGQDKIQTMNARQVSLNRYANSYAHIVPGFMRFRHLVVEPLGDLEIMSQP